MLWVLIEGRVPVIVAGQERGTGKTTVLGALLDFLPPGLRMVELAGSAETFEWLPQASELGWPRPRRRHRPARDPSRRSARTTRSCWCPSSPTTCPRTPGAPRRASRSGPPPSATAWRRPSMATRSRRSSSSSRRPPVRADDDELSRLGVVLILRRLADDRRRVVAAHYVRPTARDEHGHVQRLGPAVLATWDPASDRFEHFGWGVTPELALRVGRKAGDFEVEIDRRRDYLAGLARPGSSASTTSGPPSPAIAP